MGLYTMNSIEFINKHSSICVKSVLACLWEKIRLISLSETYDFLYNSETKSILFIIDAQTEQSKKSRAMMFWLLQIADCFAPRSSFDLSLRLLCWIFERNDSKKLWHLW